MITFNAGQKKRPTFDSSDEDSSELVESLGPVEFACFGGILVFLDVIVLNCAFSPQVSQSMADSLGISAFGWTSSFSH